MPARRRVIKIYNSKAFDENFGRLGPSATSQTVKNFPTYSLEDLQKSVRHPIIPIEKTLVGNTYPSESQTTTRVNYNFTQAHKTHEKPKPIIAKNELNVPEKGSAKFETDTFYKCQFNDKNSRLENFERPKAVKPKQGENTKKLLENGLKPIRLYNYNKPCVDISLEKIQEEQNKLMRTDPAMRLMRHNTKNQMKNQKNINTVEESLDEIRLKLKARSIGPTDAGRLLRPSSKMHLRTENQTRFSNSRMNDPKNFSENRRSLIVPKENYALKYSGKMEGKSASNSIFQRPASSCYEYEDFFVYC